MWRDKMGLFLEVKEKKEEVKELEIGIKDDRKTVIP